MKLGLTGPIGCGKSTWVRAELARRGIGAASLAGFTTRWRGERGKGILELADWRGRVLWSGEGPRERLAARAGEFAAAIRGVLEQVPECAFLAIDELGILEAGDEALRRAVAAAVERAGEALVVVQERAMEAWKPVLALDGWRRAGEGARG